MEQVLREGFEQLGLSVSENAISQFIRYGSMLETANTVMNLTAITSQRDVARLHSWTARPFSRWQISMECAWRTWLRRWISQGPPTLLQPDMALTLLDSAGKKIDFCKSVRSAGAYGCRLRVGPGGGTAAAARTFRCRGQPCRGALDVLAEGCACR